MTTSWAQRAAAAAAAPVPLSAPTIVVATGGGGGGTTATTTTATTTTSAASMADAPSPPSSSFDPRPYVVLDTNALLLSGNGGVGLSRYAKIGVKKARKGGGDDGGAQEAAAAAAATAASTTTTTATLVTTNAALAEVRDAASREALQRLQGTGVCELTLREPDDEDVKAGTCMKMGERVGEKERDGVDRHII